ncbi:MAG: hypothetical protein ACRD0W_09840 [Acidimicrobiales bacterium]
MTTHVPVRITYTQAVKRLTKIVDRTEQKHGVGCGYKDVDRNYYDSAADCRYFDANSKPRCLIGVLLAEYGVTLADMTESVDMNGETVDNVIDKLPWLTTSKRALVYLRAAQDRQDNGASWRDAIVGGPVPQLIRSPMGDPTEGAAL